jgi:hypothetical protein
VIRIIYIINIDVRHVIIRREVLVCGRTGTNRREANSVASPPSTSEAFFRCFVHFCWASDDRWAGGRLYVELHVLVPYVRVSYTTRLPAQQ